MDTYLRRQAPRFRVRIAIKGSHDTQIENRGVNKMLVKIQVFLMTSAFPPLRLLMLYVNPLNKDEIL